MPLRLIIPRGLTGVESESAVSSTAQLEPAIFTGSTLGEAFQHAASRRPDHPAIITAAGIVSHARLLQAALAMCRALREAGDFVPGDRVAMLLANGPHFPAAYYGIFLAGGAVVPIPPDTEPSRLHYIIGEGGIRIAITADVAALRRANLICKLCEVDLDAGDRSNQSTDVAQTMTPSDLAMILFTSGSTGQPKGVMLSHAAILANARIVCTHLPVGPNERALASSPFYHAFGNAVMQTHLLCGATLIIEGTLTFPKTLIDAVVRRRATSFSAVPEAWRFLTSCGAIREGTLSSLTYATSAGAPMPHDLAMEIVDLIAPARFFSLYGQTESTSRLSYVEGADLAEHPGSIGRGAPGLELEVVDRSNHRVAPGEVGEIRARSANLMTGYWRDEATTAHVLRDGWLYTGDLAVVDDEGFIGVRGRSDDIIKIGGVRLHPAEVEQIVVSHLHGVDAAVVAFEHGSVGPRLALFVRPRDDATRLTETTVREMCRASLPRHMLPTVIEIVEKFPLTPSMKLDRRALVRRAVERIDAGVTMPP